MVFAPSRFCLGALLKATLGTTDANDMNAHVEVKATLRELAILGGLLSKKIHVLGVVQTPYSGNIA